MSPWLTQVKEELVELINTDYDHFVGLMSTMNGADVLLNSLQQRINPIEVYTNQQHNDLQSIMDLLQTKMLEKEEIRKEKLLL
jgi:hypothetical protein